VLVEGAAATGPAAVSSGQIELKGNVVVILTGANIDTGRLVEVLRSVEGAAR
jgi:threonine dehydratase